MHIKTVVNILLQANPQHCFISTQQFVTQRKSDHSNKDNCKQISGHAEVIMSWMLLISVCTHSKYYNIYFVKGEKI